MTMDAHFYINTLQLLPHPEGGFYRETYRSTSQVTLQPGAGPDAQRDAAVRSSSTGIYFLLEQGNFSAFHKIASDEMWHFYAGQALEVLELHASGEAIRTRLGTDVLNGEVHQHVVRAHTWFASRVCAGGAFALVGCTVAPGFDFADFALADRAALIATFAQHRQTITELTR
jgi:predicted cupin superfamily sugar epimerase